MLLDADDLEEDENAAPPRHLLDGRRWVGNVELTVADAREKSWSNPKHVPLFEARLALRPQEWRRLRGCLVQATWPGSLGPHFSLRLEHPEDVTAESMSGPPYRRNFKVTYFWADTATTFHGRRLAEHPVFRDEAEDRHLRL